MDNVTNSIAADVKEKGINISKMASDTGVPYQAMSASLSCDKKKRTVLMTVRFLMILSLYRYYLPVDSSCFLMRRAVPVLPSPPNVQRSSNGSLVPTS